jgi:hypothetical protein
MKPSHSFACAAYLFVVLSGALYAHPRELTPSGTGDDTAKLQAALSACSHQQQSCDLRLGAGAFYTDVLLAQGFRGSIRGRGVHRTVIRPLAHQALRSAALPFITEPTLAEPYPILLHFADNSKVDISDLSLEFPAGMTVTPYEVPYPGEGGTLITTSLVAAILVDGDRDAELTATRLRIIGTDNDTYDGSNISSAIRFEGQVRYSEGIQTTRKLARGRLSVDDVRIQRSGFGIQALDANHIEGLIIGNRIDARIYAVSLLDLGASKLAVLDNSIDAELDGIVVFQSADLAPKAPSDFLIAKNKIRVNETGGALDPAGGYGGISVLDFSAYSDPIIPETIKSDITIFGNDIQVADNPVKDGIDVSGDGSGKISVVGNRIRGTPFDSGIFVDLSRGTFIAGNDLRTLDPPNRDIHLTSTANHCRVIQPGSTVLDEGSNNQVID